MHLGQASGLVIGLVQPGVAQEDDDDAAVAMVKCRWSWFVALCLWLWLWRQEIVWRAEFVNIYLQRN